MMRLVYVHRRARFSFPSISYIFGWLILFLAHIVVIGCPSFVSPSFRLQQCLPSKPLGGISPIFTYLFGPLSELLSKFHLIQKPGSHDNHKEILLTLAKKVWPNFKIIWYRWSLGHPLPKLFKLF